MKSSRISGGIVLAAFLSGGAGYAAKAVVRSPLEAAAADAPPPPSRITEGISLEVLSTTVRARGDIRFGSPRDVLLASSVLRPEDLIVTVAPERDRAIKEGDRVLEAGGRPVIVLEGATPMYRDLRPGDEGADVRQFEAALRRLGIRTGKVDGRYDGATQNGVDQWMRKAGYEAFGPTDAQRAEQRAARSTLAQAESAVIDAQRNRAEIGRPASRDKVLQADEQIAAARQRAELAASDVALSLDRAQREIDARRDALALAERVESMAKDTSTKAARDAQDSTSLDDARGALEDARAMAANARADAVNARTAIEDANLAVAEAKIDVEEATKSVADAKASITDVVGGLEPGASGMNPSVRAVQVQVRQAETAVRQANLTVGQRERAVRAAELASTRADQAVSKADAAVVRAERVVALRERNADDANLPVKESDVKAAQATSETVKARRELAAAEAQLTSTQQSVLEAERAARAQVEIAEAARRALGLAPDEKFAVAALRNAEAVRDRAKRELAAVDAKIGTVVPANEVLFLPSLPARIDDSKLLRGDRITGPVMKVTTDRLAIDSSVDARDAKLFRKGSSVRIEDDELKVALSGTVSLIAPNPGTFRDHELSRSKVYVEITIDDTSAQPLHGGSVLEGFEVTTLADRNVQVIIPVTSTGKAVLAVPVSAITTGPDEKPRVEVEDSPNDPTRFVEVRLGIKGGLLVEITPVGAVLSDGDRVVVGHRGESDLRGDAEPRDSAEG